MSRIYQTPPSQLLHLTDPYTAWCVDEAILHLRSMLAAGKKLRPKKTEDNIAMLRRMGVEIQGLNESNRR